MKRFLIGAVAAAALAMPSAASANVGTTLDAEAVAPCTTPVVYCVQQLLNAITVRHPCEPGETVAACAERISRNADDIVWDYVYDFAIPFVADTAGDVITLGEQALQMVRDACEQVSEECNAALL